MRDYYFIDSFFVYAVVSVSVNVDDVCFIQHRMALHYERPRLVALPRSSMAPLKKLQGSQVTN